MSESERASELRPPKHGLLRFHFQGFNIDSPRFPGVGGVSEVEGVRGAEYTERRTRARQTRNGRLTPARSLNMTNAHPVQA